MASFKNPFYLIHRAAAPSAITHQDAIDSNMARIRQRVCKACDMSHTAYDEAHYDLAESWFVYHDYLEYTARVFMISKIFHAWWNQQLASLENEFLTREGSQSLNTDQLRDAMFGAIITMDIHPSAELRRRMHQEGTSAFRANPELSKLKIYRNVQ